jgi:hypothetical protein
MVDLALFDDGFLERPQMFGVAYYWDRRTARDVRRILAGRSLV